jgi:GH35 family endo-1,4-beta-xylanase
MNMTHQIVSAALLATLIVSSGAGRSFAEVPIEIPPGGQTALALNRQSDVAFHFENVQATAAWKKIADMPFDSVYRVASDTRFSDPDNMRVTVPIDAAIKKGDVVLLSFWILRPRSGGQPNNVYINIDATPGETSYQYKTSAYRDWKQHVRSFVAAADLDAGQSQVRILLGEGGPSAEIADFRLINFGPDYDIASLPRSTVNYKGRQPDAKWRQEALARIEKIRKGDLTIEVVDSSGKPVTDARVKVQMQRHAFRFGNVVNAHLLGGDESMFPYTKARSGIRNTSTWQEAQKYREVVKTYFNPVTFESELRPHVWKQQMDGSRKGNQLHKILTEGAVPWLLANDIDIRGHYLSWGAMDFNDLEKQFVGDPDAHREWLWGHMADVVPKTADFISEWDTINHIIAWGKHTYEAEYGGMQIYADIMQEARRLAPDASHAINEGKILPNGYKREPYKRVIRFLNEQDQAPDVVGFMAHFGLMSLTPPEELLEVYDNFAEIAPRLQLSEFDVEVGDDDQLQSDYYRDVMIATFSHPAFVSIVQWGFWEKAHWKPAAALWRADWSLKPAGEVFVDLVKNQWWTDETITTDAKGLGQLRGFLGEYKVSVEHDGQSVSANVMLHREGATVRIQLE